MIAMPITRQSKANVSAHAMVISRIIWWFPKCIKTTRPPNGVKRGPTEESELGATGRKTFVSFPLLDVGKISSGFYEKRAFHRFDGKDPFRFQQSARKNGNAL